MRKADEHLMQVLTMLDTVEWETQQMMVLEGLKTGNSILNEMHKVRRRPRSRRLRAGCGHPTGCSRWWNEHLSSNLYDLADSVQEMTVEAVENLMLETEEAQATANVCLESALVSKWIRPRRLCRAFSVLTTSFDHAGDQPADWRQPDRRRRGRGAERARRDRADGGECARRRHARGAYGCHRDRCVTYDPSLSWYSHLILTTVCRLSTLQNKSPWRSPLRPPPRQSSPDEQRWRRNLSPYWNDISSLMSIDNVNWRKLMSIWNHVAPLKSPSSWVQEPSVT